MLRDRVGRALHVGLRGPVLGRRDDAAGADRLAALGGGPVEPLASGRRARPPGGGPSGAGGRLARRAAPLSANDGFGAVARPRRKPASSPTTSAAAAAI